jgi:hypothetical protein
MRWIFVIAVLGAACGAKEKFDESKRDVAKLKAKQLAEEAFTRWAMAHVDKQCPGDIAELEEYSNGPATDPWGNRMVLLCGADKPAAAKGAGVISLGADGKRGTADDVTSWDP